MARQTFRADSQGRQTTFDVSSPGATPRFGTQPATGIGLPGAPALQAPRPLDFSGVSQVLQGWQREARDRARQRQAEEAAQRGAQAQLEAGGEGIVETPEDVRKRHEIQAFEAQTQAVYNQQVRTAALRRASELQLEYQNNPAAFETAWEEYTNETIDAVAETNAVLAAEISGYLADVGNRGTVSLMQSQHADNLERQKAEITANLNDATASAANTVLNNPTAQVSEEQLSDLTLQAKELADQGILSGAEANRFIAGVEQVIAQNYVTGRANQAFADGDFDAVQLLVDELRTGVYFDDNNEGNRLADRFERQAGVRLKERNGVVLEHEREQLEQMTAIIQSIVERGGTASNEQLETIDELYEQLSVGISGDNRVAATQLRQGAHLLKEFNENLDEMSMADFASLEFLMTSSDVITSALPDASRRLIIDSARTNRERIADAFSLNGDPARGGRASIADAGLGETPAEDLVENAQLIAQRSGDPSNLVAFHTRERIQQTADAIRGSNGSIKAIEDTLEEFLAPYKLTGSEATGLRHLGQTDSELGGIAALAFAMSGDTGVSSAAMFMNSAVQGLSIEDGPTVRLDELSRDSRRKIEALSETNGENFTMIRQGLQAYARGQFVVEPDRTRGGREVNAPNVINDVLENVETVTFSNGISVVARELGGGQTERDLAKEAIEGVLSDPDIMGMFGGEHLRPVPVGNGRYAFRRKDSGVFLRKDPDDKTSALLNANVGEEEVLGAQEVDDQIHEQNALDAQRTADNALMLAEQPHTQFREAGQLLGMQTGDVEGFFRALSLSPARSLYRLPNGIAPEILSLAEEQTSMLAPGAFASPEQFRTPEMETALELIEQMQESVLERSLQTANLLETPLRGPGVEQRRVAQEQMQLTLGSFTMKDNGRLATLVLFNNHLQDFGGDRAKALAAIAAGRTEVDDAIEIGGEDWLSIMDEEAQAFVAKGMRVDG